MHTHKDKHINTYMNIHIRSPVDLSHVLLHLFQSHIQFTKKLLVGVLDVPVLLSEEEVQAPFLLARGPAGWPRAAVWGTLALWVLVCSGQAPP